MRRWQLASAAISALLCGSLIGRWQGNPSIPANAGSSVHSAPTGREPVPAERNSPDRLLDEMAVQVRQLRRQRAEIEQTAKADRIAWQILRGRGFDVAAPECARLVERQKRLRAELSRIEQALAELERWEARLHQRIDRGENLLIGLEVASPTDGGLGRSHDLPPATPAPAREIPDEQWQGGPEALMEADSGAM